MGGVGSGRPKTRNPRLIEDAAFLDINEIVKFGFTIYPAIAFIKSEGNKKHLFISHSFNYQSELIPIKEKIALLETCPYLEGERLRFRCPNSDRRVGKLFRL
jgi:hypothetical protein